MDYWVLTFGIKFVPNAADNTYQLVLADSDYCGGNHFFGKQDDECRHGKEAGAGSEKNRKPSGAAARPGEKKAGGSDTANQMTKTMTYFMPLMTLFFTFSLPNGISVYWIAGNVVQLVQQFIMNKFLVPKMKERAEIENDIKSENKYRKKRKKR